MIWFKHPNNLPNDKRLATLIDKEGSRGYGMYLYITEMLCAQPDGRLCFSQLRIMARKGFPLKYMKKIIREYRLFIIHEEEEFESVIDFYSKGNANHLPNDLKTSPKTVPAENEDKSLNSSSDTEKTRLARVRRDKNREEEDIKRKDDVVVQKRYGDDDDAFTESCNEIPKSYRDVVSEICGNAVFESSNAVPESSNVVSEICGNTVSESSNAVPVSDNGTSYSFVIEKDESEERPECHTLARQMPHLKPPNATPQLPPSVAFPPVRCGIFPHEVWHLGASQLALFRWRFARRGLSRHQDGDVPDVFLSDV